MVLGGGLAGLVIAQAIPAQPGKRPMRSVGVRVIDGDTFDYAGERIRILDIDTPETHPSRCAYEAQLGAQATDRLRQLLARPFELQAVGRDEDRYGRKLRLVLVGGHSVGDQLVAEGLARRYEGRRRPWCDSASVG
ncbi:thermonuclease family protein [Sphingomonas sp. ID1715]|uniref:thermonuclease family protein n=1 Tax=Sphingomonas sp. ID1715 TaxID=1656898 RepID=UPI0020C4BFEA|nr:thermonuclease family protein [Sphingomonas sp. ID1715]